MRQTHTQGRILALAMTIVVSLAAGCTKKAAKPKDAPKPGPAVAGTTKSVVGKWLWVAAKTGDRPRQPMKLESFESFIKGGIYELSTPSQGHSETGTWAQSGTVLVVRLARTKREYKFTVVKVSKTELTLYRRSKNARLFYERAK